jgi:hypothetical protein
MGAMYSSRPSVVSDVSRRREEVAFTGPVGYIGYAKESVAGETRGISLEETPKGFAAWSSNPSQFSMIMIRLD